MSHLLTSILQGYAVIKVQSFRARLLGLHGIKRSQRQQTVLWFPYCKSVHSFFLTSRHTLVFLDSHYKVLKPYQIMRSNRCYWHSQATHVVELPAAFNQYSDATLQEMLTILLARARGA